MCLGVPGKLVSVTGTTGVCDFGGVRRAVNLEVLDAPVEVGDHVLVHVGFAITRIAPEDLAATLAFFDEIAAADREPLPP